MINVKIALMILAIVCFGLHAFGTVTPRGNLQSAGLALWATAVLIG